MTTRNLSALFQPRAIAIIGASNEQGSVGAVVTRNMLGSGFPGEVFLVNPRADTISGVPAFRSVGALPTTPDLAIIATPPRTIPSLISELGDRGCRAAVVITAGLSSDQRKEMLMAARPHLMRIVGPNCLGFLSPANGINASFSHLNPLKGRLALLTQSGAIATSVIDWTNGHGIGFSHILSLGDMADVDFGDLLDWLALDGDTRAILLYAETVTEARKFMSAARIAARAKPVIVVKGGRSAGGAQAAASHTGALAATDIVYDAAFRRAGMLRVSTLRDLFGAAETLASGIRIDGNRLAILTNGGGLGVLAADALELGGGELAELSPDTVASLGDVLPASWSHGNPVDILGDAHGDRYDNALRILAADENNDAVLVMNCPTGVGDNLSAAEAVLRARKGLARPKAMIACWAGDVTAGKARRKLSDERFPVYETPDEAVQAFLQLTEFTRNQNTLYHTPPRSLSSETTRPDEARAIIAGALSEGRSVLTEPEAKSILAAYGVPVVQTFKAATPQDAADAARRIDGAVALKILSKQITHKSDVGGVALDLPTPERVESAAQEMLDRIRQRVPEAVIDGFTVQHMVSRPKAHELILGAAVDPTFGPCLLFGHGGVATEVIADRVIGFPPLNSNLALDMVRRTRVSRLLEGYRDRKPADLDAIVAAMLAVSAMVIDLEEIAELDINPLLADEKGVIALDARIVVRPTTAPRIALAIRPWPRELDAPVTLGDETLRVRPIRPEDSAGLLEMAQRTSAADLRMRFHGSVGQVSAETTARLSQIDYDREMVLVAQDNADALCGVVRMVFDPDFTAAECAIIVRTDSQGKGLGRHLLQRALDYARTRGTSRVWGDILSGNERSVDLARRLGADCARSADDPKMVRAEFRLG